MVVVKVAVVFIVFILTCILFFVSFVVDLIEDADVASPALNCVSQSLQRDVWFIRVQLEGLKNVVRSWDHEVFERFLDFLHL